MRKKVLIVGAGLTGLSTAYHLKKHKIAYQIFEKEPSPGGLCRSVEVCGFHFDYTGHLLHTRTKYGKEMIKELLKGNLRIIKRNAWIYSHRRYIPYPFQANIYGLPHSAIKECITGFIDTFKKRKKARKNIYSFQDWVVTNFGGGFAKYFFFPYNEKLWKIPLKELSVAWMGRYVPFPSIREVLTGALTCQDKSFGYNISFLYPQKEGIQALVEALSRKVEDIQFSNRLIEVDLKKRIATFEKGDVLRFDVLISTIPLKEFVLNVIKAPPQHIKNAARDLRHNSVLNINFGIKKAHLSDKHWIYFPEKDIVFYRIGFPRNFSHYNVPQGMSSISTEISYLPNKKPKPDITERVQRDLIRCGILKKDDRIFLEKVLNIKYAYVIYDKNYYKVQLLKDFLARHRILSIGRYGGWNYSTMEDAILDGKRVLDKIIN